MMSDRLYRYLSSKTLPVDVPNGKVGPWEVSDVVVSEDQAEAQNMRCRFQGTPEYMVAPATYKRLTRDGTVVMSNTPFEVLTNQPILQNAKGHVLINGFGLGMIVGELMKNPAVKQITVIEIDEDVLRLVGATYGLTKYHHEGPTPLWTDETGKVMVWIDNALTRRVQAGERYGAVWHDIWDTVCADNLEDMRRLHRKYAKKADWQGSWCKPQCQILKRRA